MKWTLIVRWGSAMKFFLPAVKYLSKAVHCCLFFRKIKFLGAFVFLTNAFPIAAYTKSEHLGKQMLGEGALLSPSCAGTVLPVRYRGSSRGMILIAFGVGLLVARFFPAQFLLAVLAALLVMFGVALCRNFC